MNPHREPGEANEEHLSPREEYESERLQAKRNMLDTVNNILVSIDTMVATNDGKFQETIAGLAMTAIELYECADDGRSLDNPEPKDNDV